MAHQDFMLEEMQQVALDLHEEHFYKRSMLARLAIEAKIAWITREERKVQQLQQSNQAQLAPEAGEHVPGVSSLLNPDPHDLLGAAGAATLLPPFPGMQGLDHLPNEDSNNSAGNRPNDGNAFAANVEDLFADPGAGGAHIDLDDLWNEAAGHNSPKSDHFAAYGKDDGAFAAPTARLDFPADLNQPEPLQGF